MAVPNESAMVAQLVREGYFDKARAGDHRACGLFARLVAYRLNPTGDPNGWGWLTKQPGQKQVEGYSEDGIVYGSDPNDLQNVVDIIIGAGQPNARTAWQPQPRRANNTWERPRPLTALELNYLKAGSVSHPEPVPAPQPHVCPPPPAPEPPPPYPDEQTFWRAYEVAVVNAYKAVGREIDSQTFRWFARCCYDIVAGRMTPEDAAVKHLAELKKELGV